MSWPQRMQRELSDQLISSSKSSKAPSKGSSSSKKQKKVHDGDPGSGKAKASKEADKISQLGKKLMKYVSEMESQLDKAQTQDQANAPWLSPIMKKCTEDLEALRSNCKELFSLLGSRVTQTQVDEWTPKVEKLLSKQACWKLLKQALG